MEQLTKERYLLNAEAENLAALIPHEVLWDWYDAVRMPRESRRRGAVGPRRMRLGDLYGV